VGKRTAALAHLRNAAVITVFTQEVVMNRLRSAVTSAALLLNGAAVAAAELPTYEVAGFPVSPHQFSIIGSADVRERYARPALTLAGMPASPHQVSVLRITRE
jgi:hypothetical protein